MGCSSAKSYKKEKTPKNLTKKGETQNPTTEQQKSKELSESKENQKLQIDPKNMGDAPIVNVSAKVSNKHEEVELSLFNKQIIAVKKENGVYFIDYMRNRYSNRRVLPNQSKCKFIFIAKDRVGLMLGEKLLAEKKLSLSNLSRITAKGKTLLAANKNGCLVSARMVENRLKVRRQLNIRGDLLLFDEIEGELIILNSKSEVFMLNEDRMRLIVRDIGIILSISVQKSYVWLVDNKSNVSAYELQTCKRVTYFSLFDEIVSAFFLEDQVVLVTKDSIKVATLEGEILKQTENKTKSFIIKVFESSSFAVLASNNLKTLNIWDKEKMEIVKSEDLNSPIFFG